MTMTRFILVRHGETKWNKEGRYQGKIDTPLSPFGVEQGLKVGKALADVPIDICYSSPLSRCLETAKMCCAAHSFEPVTDQRLLEINHGEWEGLLASDVEEKWPDILKKWRTSVVDADMPGGENIQTVKDRCMAAINEYALKHLGKTVLVVAHDAVNKAIICDILGIDLSCFWQIKQDNTSLNIFEWQDGKWRLVLMNSTTHLGFLFSGIEQKGL